MLRKIRTNETQTRDVPEQPSNWHSYKVYSASSMKGEIINLVAFFKLCQKKYDKGTLLDGARSPV